MVPQTDCLAWHALSKHDLALGTQGPPRSTTRDIESHFVQPRAHTRVQPLSLHSTNIKSDHARSARFNTPDPPSKGPTLSTAELFDVRGRPTARLYNEQGSDPEIAAIRAYLEDGAVPLDPRLNKRVTRNGHQFTVRQGIVCRYVTIETPLWIAELCFGPATAPHSQDTSGLARLESAFLDRLDTRLQKLRHLCPDCNKAKGGRPTKQGPIQRMPVYDLKGPFDLMVVDALGPLPTTENGNKYILVFGDYFTRWIEAFPVPHLKTSTFARTLIDEVLCRFVVPNSLLSVRGSNFLSELAESMYATLGIHKLTSAPYHPQSQGLVERFNHTIIQMLKIFVNDHHTDWDTYLPRLLFAYRTSHQETLGDSPYFCLFGRDPSLPLDLTFLNSGSTWKSDDLPQYKRRLASSWKQTRTLVERQLVVGQNKSAHSRTDRKPIEFEEQSSVWLYKYFSKSSDPSDNRSRKLATHWHGPYRVHRRLGPNTYQLEVPTHPDRLITVNVDRLKPFRGYYSRPYNDDVPNDDTDLDDLTLDCLPRSSFVEQILFPDKDVAYTNSGSPIYRVVDKRRAARTREADYLVEHVDGSKYWNPLSKLSEYRTYIGDYESQLRMDRGLPPLRRSPRFRDLDLEPLNDTLF
ncbi:hypothetical protein AeMF1_017069 [Aphanomyces euteiches]|nr:hypothetical protein AeMF1_017069 [Aphanomyces euteiches]